MLKQEIIKRVSFEELLVVTGGCGISQVEIVRESPILNKTLRESGLRKADVTILVIERDGTSIPNPHADEQIRLQDKLICFGKLENIRSDVCGVMESSLEEGSPG